jgi:hypothetical protein
MLHALVFSAKALVVLHWTENLGTEETIFFGLKGPIVDGFGLLDLSMRPVSNLLWRGQADSNSHVVERVLRLFVEVVDVLHERLQLKGDSQGESGKKKGKRNRDYLLRKTSLSSTSSTSRASA